MTAAFFQQLKDDFTIDFQTIELGFIWTDCIGEPPQSMADCHMNTGKHHRPKLIQPRQPVVDHRFLCRWKIYGYGQLVKLYWPSSPLSQYLNLLIRTVTGPTTMDQPACHYGSFGPELVYSPNRLIVSGCLGWLRNATRGQVLWPEMLWPKNMQQYLSSMCKSGLVLVDG